MSRQISRTLRAGLSAVIGATVAFSSPVAMSRESRPDWVRDINSFEIEMSTPTEAIPGTSQKLKTSVSVVQFPANPLDTTGQSRDYSVQQMIDWVGRKYSLLWHEGVQAQVLVVPPDHELFNKDRVLRKFTKELGWSSVNKTGLTEEGAILTKETAQILEQLQDKISGESTVFIGTPSRPRNAERLFGAVLRSAMVGGVAFASIIVSLPDTVSFAERLVMAGIPAVTGGTMSGLLQYYKDQVDQRMKHRGLIHVDPATRVSWPEFALRQFFISVTWMTIFRSAMWASGVVDYPDFFNGVTETLRMAALTAFASMRSTIAFNKVFAEMAPAPSDHSPRAERIRNKGRRMALLLSAITTVAEVFYQMQNTQYMGEIILWGLTGTGVVMLGTIYKDAISQKLTNALSAVRREISSLRDSTRRGGTGFRCQSLFSPI